MTVEEIKKEYNNLIACVQGEGCCDMNCSECPYDNHVSSYDLMLELRFDLEKIEEGAELVKTIDKFEKCVTSGLEKCTMVSCTGCDYKTDMTMDEVVEKGIELLENRNKRTMA